jgi:hypothetical protein
VRRRAKKIAVYLSWASEAVAAVSLKKRRLKRRASERREEEEECFSWDDV